MKNKVIRTGVRLLLAAVVLAGLVAGGRAVIQGKKKELEQSPKFHLKASRVDTATSYLGDLVESHDYLAQVEPVQAANIAARVTATVETVEVDEGDTVTKGQQLITLDDRQIRAQLTAMEAQIKQVQAELEGNQATVTSLKESLSYWSREAERDRKLAESGSIPSAQAEITAEKKNEFEGKLAAARKQSTALEQQIHSLKARGEELQTTLSYCILDSPFAGTITSRRVDPGDQAAPGRTLLVLETSGAMMVTFDVPQTDLPAVKPGLSVSLKTDGDTCTAAITRLYPSLNRARMMRAEVVLSDTQVDRFTSGQYLTASVLFRRREQVPLIPIAALIEGDLEPPRVFLVKDGRLQAHKVRVLGTACELAAVDGVEAGEQVVVSSFLGWARLSDGLKVETRP